MVLHHQGNMQGTTLIINNNFSELVQKSESHQESLRSVVEKSNRFSREEKAALCLDSVHDFEIFWQSACQARYRFETDRKHGTKRTGKQILDFGATAYEVLHSMSPMLEVIRDLGAPYGSLAIGTISCLFAVSSRNTRKYVVSSAKDIRLRRIGLVWRSKSGQRWQRSTTDFPGSKCINASTMTSMSSIVNCNRKL